MDDKPEKIPVGQCILYPAGYVRQRLKTGESPEWGASRLFGPMLGTRKVRQNNPDPYTVMVSDQPGHRGRSLFFPAGHPLEGQEAYRWFVLVEVPGGWKMGESSETWNGNPEAVRIGYRRADDEPVSVEAQDRGRAAKELHVARLSDPEVAERRLAQMVAAGIIDGNSEEAKAEETRVKGLYKAAEKAEAKEESGLEHTKRPKRAGSSEAPEAAPR